MICIDPGKLRAYLLIENPTETQSASGHAAITWAAHRSVWGRITPKSGLERVVADHVHADTTHVIHIRYCPGVTSKSQAKYQGRTFEFLAAVNVDELDEWMMIVAKEIT